MGYKYWNKIHAVGVKPSKIVYLTNDIYKLMSTFTSRAAYVQLEIGMMNRYGNDRQQHKQAIIKTLDHDR